MILIITLNKQPTEREQEQLDEGMFAIYGLYGCERYTAWRKVPMRKLWRAEWVITPENEVPK